MAAPHTTQETRNRRSDATRLEVRINAKDKQLIEQAARASHATTTAFVLQAVMQAVEDVLRRDQVTVVPPDFYDAMIASLDAPAEPNETLANAARRSREIIRRK